LFADKHHHDGNGVTVDSGSGSGSGSGTRSKREESSWTYRDHQQKRPEFARNWKKLRKRE
jgi:hypothetical protein